MAKRSECLQSGPCGVCAANDIPSHHNDDKMGENIEAVEVHEGGLLIVLEKNKKKKKKQKGGLQSPKRILTFNTSELSKLDEQKGEMMKKGAAEGVKTSSKRATLPINASFKGPGAEGLRGSEHAKEDAISSSPSETSCALTQAGSLPLKSALRGGYEELGMGPRPKLQVKWDPNVREPPCSTISHTVNKNRPKKKGTRHAHKSKSSRDDIHKKHDKKKSHKAKGGSGLGLARVHYPDGDKEGKSCSSLQFNCSGEDNEVLASTSTAIVSLLGFNGIAHTEVNCEYADSSLEGIAGVVKYPLESTCGGPYFGPGRVSCTVCYGKAM